MAGMKSLLSDDDLYAMQTADNRSFTGASSLTGDGWHAINWRKVHRNVQRLQARIVKATQEQRWGKVKALQRLLTRSFSGKAIAVKRVTENQGKRTPGVDGICWSSPDDKQNAIKSMRQHGYKAKPLRRIYIPKPNGKERPLSIPTMADRAMQALYLLALDPISETLSDLNSYGFRKSRAPADAIQQCFTVLSLKASAQWVLEGDIKSCFDQIDHQWVSTHIPLEKPVLNQWLIAAYVDNNQLHPTTAGVPQGGIISPVIANMTLDGMEAMLKRAFPRHKGLKVNLIRFADDFIITGHSKELLEEQVKPLVIQFLAERGLTLSPHKTHITHINDGFDFLGKNVRKYNGKLLIKPSKQNVAAFIRKIRSHIRKGRQAPTEKLIAILNPVIRGWVNYHRHTVSKQTFADVDYHIFRMLWSWACRRHSDKSRKWVQQRYFPTVGNRQWVFAADAQLEDGQTRCYSLIKAADTPIQRHIKIRKDANPYDPAWRQYFKQRLDTKMVNSLKGRSLLLHLWVSQRGVCPICQQEITLQTGWHNHHVIGRSQGGSDEKENRVLLHPNCHRQFHSQSG